MGRKRQTRKRADLVHSKTSLNSVNVSSDSESETSLVSRKESQTIFSQKMLTNGSADIDCNAPTQPTGASINHTGFGQHCFTGKTVQAERAHTSFDRSVSKENIPSENMQPAQSDHGQHPISVPSDDYDTDQTTQRLPVNTGRGRFVSQLNSRRESTLCSAQPDTPLQSTSLSGETADTDQTIHAHSTGRSISCGQGRGYLVSHETQRGKNTSYAQADHGLPSALESGVNSDTDHNAYYVNPIRTDRPTTHREYSGSQGIARGEAVLSNTQAGTDLRSTAPILQTSQTENLRVGSGDDTSLQNNWDSVTSVIQNFGLLISQQNEALNARIRQQNETHNAQVRQQNEAHDARMRQQNKAQDARMRQQNESRNKMLSECLAEVTNVVRQGIAEIAGLRRQSDAREVTQNNVRRDTVSSPPSTCNRSTNTVVASNIQDSKTDQPGHSVQSIHTESRYCHADRPDSLPAIHVSESQIYPRHAGQDDTSRPIPGNLCGPSDVSVKQTDTQGDVPTIATSDVYNTVFNPSETNIRNTNTAANTSGQHEAFSRNKGVKLPVFSGNSSESWKVWFSRISTVANLNNWDDSTRLSELLQRLDGTAAEFVFDEIPSEINGNFQSLVHELISDSRNE